MTRPAAARGKGSPKYAGRDDVIRAILRMEVKGKSLKASRVRETDRELSNAAVRLFGNWGKALRAAGIDPEKVSGRRNWTLQRVVRAIHALHRRGIALNYGAAYKADSGIPQAAAKLFGSWDAALEAAGYEPDHIRQQRHQWTRDEIIELIRRRAEQGLALQSYAVEPQSAEVASRKLFGSWKAALRAAGVPNPMTEFPIWTKVSVVEGILIRQSKGKAMHCAAAAHEASRLYDGARRCFGTWKAALEAAGIDPANVQRRHLPYTREDIVEHIRDKRERGEPYERTFHHPVSIIKAARRLFGSWKATIRAARRKPGGRHHRRRRR